MTTIKIGNKSYPYRQTMGAAVRFKRMTGREVSEVKSDQLEDAMAIIYCGVASACNADGVPFELDFDTFCDMLDMETVSLLNGEGEQKKTKK